MKRFGSGVVSLLLVAVLTAMLSPVSMSFAAVLNDEVTSVKLKEADGTSGQNTNSGSGVKTGHIQDGAVTAVKIIDGAVTDAKITGTISGSKLGAHGHNASDLVGTINSSNLPIGTASGTVAAGDHSHDSAYQKKYANVAVVATSGGDYSDLQQALAATSTWCGAAPCLLKIMPGSYNLSSGSNGNTYFAVPENITLEGSGEGLTTLNAGVLLQNGSEVRSLTINAMVGGVLTEKINSSSTLTTPAVARDLVVNLLSNGSVGVANSTAVDIELTNVKITNAGFTPIQISIPFDVKGLYVYSKATLNNVTISLPNGGVGIRTAYSGSAVVANSTIDVTADYLALLNGGSGLFAVNNSLINGGIAVVSSPIKCFGTFDANYNAVACQ